MRLLPARYKIPLLIALVVSLAIIALNARSIDYWFQALILFLGSLIGVLLLDFEYILQVYLVDPKDPHAEEIKRLIKDKNIYGYFDYIDQNQYSFGELSLRSMMFQALLTVFTLYIVSTGALVLVQSMALTMLAVLLYEQAIELQDTGTLKRWFWIYNGEFAKRGYIAYMSVLTLLFLYLFTFV